MYDKIEIIKTKVEIPIHNAGREESEPDARNMPVKNAQNSPDAQPHIDASLVK